MKAVRHAVLAILAFGAAIAGSAQESRSAPEPSEVIFPRGASTSPAPEAASNAFAPPSTSGTFMSAFGYIAVLALMVGGAWLLVKRGTLPRPFTKNDGRLKVLETRMLGNRQFLIVVEYDEAKMLLGVCQGRIDYLTPLAGHPLAAAAAAVDEDEQQAGSYMAAAVAGERR